MQYDVEADWQLLNTCNYRCSYCFFGDDILGQKLQTYAEPEAWRKAFDATGLTWLIHMTGGEPSVYPQFPELTKLLTERHFISINSNMTHKSWEQFAREIDPSRVSFINAGLHLVERKKKAGFKPYLDNISLLRSAGFQIMTSLVMTPEAIDRFEEARSILESIGMYPVPKVMRGPLDGKSYPAAYTLRQRRLFRRYAAEAQKFYQPMLAQRDERATIDIFGDETILRGERNYSGLSCEAGRLFFKVEPNGDIWRCGPSKSYGNLLDGSFKREPMALPCDTRYCFYFCDKYSEPQPLSRKIYQQARFAARDVRNALRDAIAKSPAAAN